MSKLVSVILTGGKSSRMGYVNKSFLKIKGKYTDSKLINFENIKFVEGKNSIDIQCQ